MSEQQPVFILQQEPRRAQPMSKDEPPLRVQAAIYLLGLFSSKTADKPSGAEVGNSVEGKPLDLCEQKAQAAACDLLADYFHGKLKFDRWERLDIEKREQKVQDSECNEVDGMPLGAGVLMRCPGCAPNFNRPNCALCKGVGEVMIFPVVKEE